MRILSVLSSPQTAVQCSIVIVVLLMDVTSASGQVIVRSDEPSVPAKERYCWRNTDIYQPPDFAGYFPDDREGADALEALWQSTGQAQRQSDGFLDIVRRGLRRYEGNPTPVLRCIGETFIRNRVPQDPEAIELMYHATGAGEPDFEYPNIRGAAIQFGLSMVRPKTPSVLRALMEVAIVDDDPHDLSRIAWGVGNQRDEAIQYLEFFYRSPDRVVRDKAAVVEKIVMREVKAFDWAEERMWSSTEERVRAAMPIMVDFLRTGSSEERFLILAFIEQEGALRSMDEAYIEAFAVCAEDPSPGVRRVVARMVGQRWIASARSPDFDAVELAMQLSRDSDDNVRYNAVCFGLSVIPQKSERIVRRLLEIVFDGCEPSLYDKIAWGLQTQRSFTRAVLDSYTSGDDAKRALAARMVYADMGGIVASD